jgi:hypothetical protein
MNVQLLRPRVSDLVFQLYGRPVHPELFDILASRTIQHGDYRLSVQITRTGHVISWENRNVFLTEIAAASDQPLPQKRRLLHRRLCQEQSTALTCAHGVRYQASFQVEILQPEIFLHIHEEIVADGSKRGLLHRFEPTRLFALSPLGFVTAEARPGCLFLCSFHTFPEELTVVKTQSLIEMAQLQ